MNIRFLQTLILCALTIGFASCGEDFDLSENVTDEVMTEFALDRDTLYLRVGDVYEYTTSFNPPDINDASIYWTSSADSVATVQNNAIHALSPGWTILTATSVSYHRQALSHVCVLDSWSGASDQYPYESVVYASAKVGGQDLEPNCEVAAFVNDECRGAGKRIETHGKVIWAIRVGSFYKAYDPDFLPSKEVVVFKYYNPDSRESGEFRETIIHDCKTHGMPSSPFTLTAK